MLGTSRVPVTFKFVVSTVVPVKSSFIVNKVPEVPVNVKDWVDDCTSSTMSVLPLIKSIFGSSAGFVEFLYGVISMFLAIGCYSSFYNNVLIPSITISGVIDLLHSNC
jgi:hypothetical protein